MKSRCGQRKAIKEICNFFRSRAFHSVPMKTLTLLTVTALITLASPGFADSKRTADYLRIEPTKHVDKEVTVDVLMVHPTHWKSPVAELAFFHATTIDRTDKNVSGTILVAVAADEAADFAKKYGTDYEGKNNRHALTGKFILVNGKGPSGLWMIDTTDKVAGLLKENKLAIPDGDKGANFGGRIGRFRDRN